MDKYLIMKILISSDWHIHNYREFDEDGSRMGNILKSIEDQFIYATNNDIETIVCGGDMVHQQRNTPIKVTLEIIKFFTRMFKDHPTVTMYGITGNHDLGEKAVLGSYENLTSWAWIMDSIFEGFICFDGSSVTVYEGTSSCNLVGIPYLEFKEDFSKALDIASEYGVTVPRPILFIHQTPHLPNLNIPMDTDPNDTRYDVFDHVFCGHIHKRMELNNKFTLIGTPIQHGFDEGGLHVKNGFIVYDTITKDKVWINTDYPKFVEIKEGQAEPSNCYIRVLPTFKGSSAIAPAQREKFANTTKREDILKAYYDAEGEGDNDVLDVGLKIIAQIF